MSRFTGMQCLHGRWIGQRRGAMRVHAPPLCRVCGLSKDHAVLPDTHAAIEIQNQIPRLAPVEYHACERRERAK